MISYKIRGAYLLGAIIFICAIFLCFKDGYAFSHAYDRLSTSAPGASTTHTIVFEVSHGIPAGGQLVFTPAGGEFFIENGFGPDDIDFATSTSLNGTYTERLLATSSGASHDGVSVIASTSNDSVTIALNTSFGISAGEYVRLVLGQDAHYDAQGDRTILNPSTIGAYKVFITGLDASDNYIERAELQVAIVEPVTASLHQEKYRFFGSPNGWLAYGTIQTYMSLNTNYLANCRYSTASGTLYTMMTDFFDNTNDYFHRKLLTGITSGQTYEYFVRCRDLLNVDDTDDYVISFSIEGQENTGGDVTGTPGPGGGGSGGGSGGGLGREVGRSTKKLLPYPPLPDTPGVAFAGYAYPNVQVHLLQDGVEIGEIPSVVNASFGAFLEDITQGVYTFGLWATDSAGRRSITYSTTFWIDNGTQTVVSDIILPPTIQLNKNIFTAGETVNVFGQSSPGAMIELEFFPKKEGKLSQNEIATTSVVASDTGVWSSFISTASYTEGGYRVKARSLIAGIGYSGFGETKELTLGQAQEENGACPGADLNRDGRVNITDFSILLFYWGTDNECADQNQNGNVDLIDFSIMLYYWTG